MSYEVAIIGGGHNGLVCATFLAKAGKRVIVLEARDIVGGFCSTEETVPEAPGFKMNPTCMDHVVTNIPRSVVDDLDLARFGSRWIVPDPFYSYLPPEGSAICVWRDHHRTVEEIRKLSRPPTSCGTTPTGPSRRRRTSTAACRSSRTTHPAPGSRSSAPRPRARRT